jgi:hypothetical protein
MHGPYPNFAMYPMLNRLSRVLAPGWENTEDTYRRITLGNETSAFVYNHLHFAPSFRTDPNLTAITILPRTEYFDRHQLPHPSPALFLSPQEPNSSPTPQNPPHSLPIPKLHIEQGARIFRGFGFCGWLAGFLLEKLVVCGFWLACLLPIVSYCLPFRIAQL